MHTRAFGDMNILIYGKDPLVPMKLEQTFAIIRPADEIKFDSFEDYDQAYDFCKENKNIGLVFLLENCGELELDSVFKQFSKLNEQQDTCFGILVHAGMETIKGMRAAKNNDNIIGYYDVNDLLDQDKAPYLLKEIWEKYQDAFEKQVIPAPLAQTYKNMALHHASEEEIVFKNRICTLLTNQMNVSWKESFALKWFPVLEVIEQHEKSLLEANSTLKELYDQIRPTEGDLETVAAADCLVAKKVSAATSLINNLTKSQSLENHLAEITAKVTPRSKALLRTMKRHQEQIIQISQELQQASQPRLRRVV